MKKNILLIVSMVLTVLIGTVIVLFKVNSLYSAFFFIIPVIAISHTRRVFSIIYTLILLITLNAYFLFFTKLINNNMYIFLIQIELTFLFISIYLSFIVKKKYEYKNRLKTYNELIDYSEKRDENNNFYENIIKYTLKKFVGENIEFLLIDSDKIVKKRISSSKNDVSEIEEELKNKKSIYSKVLEGEKIYINNLKKNKEFILKSNYNKIMLVPIQIADEIVGILKIESNLKKKYSSSILEEFCEYSKILGFIIESHEFYEMGLYDELLEIPTERYVHKKMDQIFDENKKSSILYSIALLDIDNFKKINEFYGSINGDIILKESLKIIKRKLSKDDFIGRISGNRFILILENRGKYISKNFLEDLRDEYSNKSFFIKQRKENLTFSVGLVSLPIDNAKNYIELKELLESRLYKAKLSGKNHIIEF